MKKSIVMRILAIILVMFAFCLLSGTVRVSIQVASPPTWAMPLFLACSFIAGVALERHRTRIRPPAYLSQKMRRVDAVLASPVHSSCFSKQQIARLQNHLSKIRSGLQGIFAKCAKNLCRCMNLILAKVSAFAAGVLSKIHHVWITPFTRKGKGVSPKEICTCLWMSFRVSVFILGCFWLLVGIYDVSMQCGYPIPYTVSNPLCLASLIGIICSLALDVFNVQSFCKEHCLFRDAMVKMKKATSYFIGCLAFFGVPFGPLKTCLDSISAEASATAKFSS